MKLVDTILTYTIAAIATNTYVLPILEVVAERFDNLAALLRDLPIP